MDEQTKRKIIDNIKSDVRISIMINLLWEDIRYGIRDKELVMVALSELLDEKESPMEGRLK